MEEMTNQEKMILKAFSEFSDEELIHLIKVKSILYSRLINSEEIARKILANHGRTFYKRNESFKYNYFNLLKCAALRGIDTDKLTRKAKASLNDIISRIEENRYKEISMIDEYCYKYDSYRGNGNWGGRTSVKDNEPLGADIMIAEVSELYDSIIEEVNKKYSQDSQSTKTK